MATSPEKIMKYSQIEHLLPPDAQGTGCAKDPDGRFVIVGFKTRREIIEEIGYLASDAETPIIHACMNALCELMQGRAVMSAGLRCRDEIAALLSDDGSLGEADAPYAVMAELALQYALHDYAKTRTGVTM